MTSSLVDGVILSAAVLQPERRISCTTCVQREIPRPGWPGLWPGRHHHMSGCPSIRAKALSRT